MMVGIFILQVLSALVMFKIYLKQSLWTVLVSDFYILLILLFAFEFISFVATKDLFYCILL